MTHETATIVSTGWGRKIRRFAPLAVIGGAIAAALSLGVGDYLTFDALRENRHTLATFVNEQGALAIAAFLGIYVLVTALSLPGGAILSIAGGFLFGAVFGTAYIVIGATLGAVGIFIAAQTALGDSLKAKAGPWLKKMEAGFQENALSYLLVLRLVPLFPFFVVNLVPAFLGVRLKIFTIGTAIGIIPGAFVFASVGAGLGSVFDSDAEFSPASALTPEVITALIGLSILSLVPLAYKKIRARQKVSANSL